MKHIKKLMILGSMIGMMGMTSAAEAGTTVIFSSGNYHAVRPQPYYVNTFYGPPAYVMYKPVSWKKHHYRHNRYDRHDRHRHGHRDRDRHWHR